MAKAYNPYSVDDCYEDDEEEVATAEWNWGKKTVIVSNPWEKEDNRFDNYKTED